MRAATFGERLVADRLLSSEQVHKALEMQQMLGGRLGTNLLELGYLDEHALLEHLGRFHAMPIVQPVDLRNIPRPVLRSVPPKLVRRCGLIPFQVKGKTLLVASKDPGDPLHEDEISFMTGFMVRTHLSLELHFDVALRRFYKAPLAQRLVALTRRLSTPSPTIPPLQVASVQAPSAQAPSALAPSARAAFLRQEPVASTLATLPPAPASIPATPVVRASTASIAVPPASLSAPPSVPDIEQIELDAADLALLRTPSTTETSTTETSTAADVTSASLALPDVDASVLEPETADVDEAEDPFDDPMPDRRDADALAAWAGRRLQATEIRDEIGDVLLAVAGATYRRAALVIRRKDELMGWMADGEGVPADFRRLQIAATAPSVFFGLQSADSFWLGPLPPLPANGELVSALGGVAPKDCLVLPISLRSKILGYLYVDNAEAGVAGMPVADMKRLVAKAGLAFEIYILRNKIRMM